MYYLIKDDLKETIGQIQKYLPSYLDELGFSKLQYKKRGRVFRFAIRIVSLLLPRLSRSGEGKILFTVVTWSNIDHIRLESLKFNIVPWMYDVWDINKAVTSIQSLGSSKVLLSSADAKDLLSAKLPHVDFRVLFESIEPARYEKHKPKLNTKDIDLFVYGRNPKDKELDEIYTNTKLKIFSSIKSSSYHLSDEEFVLALWRSRFALSYPKSYTDPLASNGISAITQRYLEQMYCEVITVGIAPRDLVIACGYDPVINVDLFIYCCDNNLLSDPYFDYIRTLNKKCVTEKFLLSHAAKMIFDTMVQK